MVYQSGRGNKTGGVQNISTWRNIILSTGEDTIINVNMRTFPHVKGGSDDNNQASCA